MKKITGISIIVFGILIWITCARNAKNPFGIDVLQRPDMGQERLLVLNGAVRDTSFWLEINTGRSSKLSLGSFAEFTAFFAIQFDDLKDLPQGSVVERADLILHPLGILGDTLSPPFEAHLLQMLQDWEEDSVLWDQMEAGYASDPLSTILIHPTVGQPDTLPLPPGLVRDWIDTTRANYGLLLAFDEAPFVKIFYSRENRYRYPQLRIISTSEGERDTIFIRARKDVSLIRSSWEIPPTRLMVGSGVKYYTLLKFDLSAISKRATINRAYLRLMLDPIVQVKRENYRMRLAWSAVTSAEWNPTSLTIDTTAIDTLGLLAADSLVLNVTRFVQDWLIESNYGLWIAPWRDWEEISRIGFYDSSAESDSLYWPRLTIYYTEPAVP